MHLKSLKLVGFKSFADRTRLEFRPGVTVVVGPNGSGKSNIVDAVAWVMGTQSPKSLRTDKMDDVIFAGTATRPGLGRAEVTLVIDNGSGALPLDLPEVSITRRLYRDGSSDYEINGVGCRLLDIQELLSDSGVGRHQHVIIGQGQIDSVLSAGPDDHRAVIEEAAGILKHRVRKDKAIRRLERTDGDVQRLHDLLGELVRQMRPLKRQAEAAARHDGVRADVRALRLYLSGEELRSIADRRAAIASEEAELRQVQEEARSQESTLGVELGELRLAAGEVGEALDRDTSAAARIETTIERLRRIAQVSHERHRAMSARLEGAADRRRDLVEEAETLGEELRRGEAEEQTARLSAERAEREFRRLEDDERSLADQEGMSIEGAIAVVRGDLRALEAAEERDAREAQSTDRRAESVGAQLLSDRAEIERVDTEIADLDALAGEAQRRYAAAESERRRHQGVWEQAERAKAEAEVAVAAAAAKLEALEQVAEGLADPDARRLVETAEGALGSLAQRLDVPAEHAAAVDAALGAWADAVAFRSSQDLEAAIGSLKGAGRGGVPMVLAGDGTTESIARSVAAELGVEALVDLLGVGADRSLATRLIGDVVLVEGWAAAWRVVIRHPQLRAVTPEGDLVAAGAVRVAHPDGATPAMIEAAQAALGAAHTGAARAASLHVSARRAFDESRTVERDELETLESLEAQLAGATETLGRLGRSVGALETELERLQERRSALAETRAARAGQRQALATRLAALEGEEAERQQAWEELDRRRQEVAESREAARHAWQEAVAALRALVERRQLGEARLQAISRSLDIEENDPADPDRLDRLATIGAAARQALAALTIHLETLRGRQAELRERAGETGRRLGDVQNRLESATRRGAAARDRLAALAVESAESRVRAEAVAEGLRRDVDCSEEEALAAPVPDVETDDLAGLLASREAELRRMGPVNPLAAQEYAELEERHRFLTEQLADLEQSRDELRKVIQALDAEIQTQFLAAFEEIAAGYGEHFGVLFPGGAGRLRMTDPEHPLSSGVEIEAQPLGKKVSKMSLLSGGERSLAALAFLFAVFKARPSPFYILDEVEAALDDANLHRFLRLLGRFRDDAQLLVITHQQQTMETADVLYGVTMEPGGSSKVVAKPLSEMGRVHAAAEGVTG